MPYYALSWILTWFSHDFENYEKVVRLFDLFISSPATMPIFIASAVCVCVCVLVVNEWEAHEIILDHITTEKRNPKSRGGCSSFFGYTNPAKHGY